MRARRRRALDPVVELRRIDETRDAMIERVDQALSQPGPAPAALPRTKIRRRRRRQKD